MATIHKYNTFLKTQMNGGDDTTGSSAANAARVIDFDNNTLKIMLCTSSYAPNVATQACVNSVTNEVSGAGYTAGGITLTGCTLTLVGGTVTFDANDVTWFESVGGFTDARYAVIYKDTGTANTSTLFAYIDLISNKGNSDADLVIQMNALGIATWV